MREVPQLRGEIDIATRSRVAGWVVDEAAPHEPVSLLITAGQTRLARILANRPRADLAAEGGRHGFDVPIDPLTLPVEACRLDIRREADGLDVPGSPVLLPPVAELDAGMQTALARLFETPCDDAELRRRIAFLAQQTEHLLQWRAATQNVLGERLIRTEHRWRWSIPIQPTLLPAGVQRRALVIADAVPADDAHARGILSHMQSLQRLDYSVTFAAADRLPGVAASAVEALGVEECLAPWYMSVEELLRGRLGAFDLVYLHGVHVASCYAALVRRYQPSARLIYGVADLVHLRLQRQAAVESRPELQAASRHARAQEMVAANTADAVIAHSTAEADILRRDLPRGRVHRVPRAVAARPTRVPFARRSGVAFIGDLAQQANLDAALRLVEEIMPLVWRHDASVECFLIGAPPTEPAPRLTRPGVELVGAVADLMEVFDRVRVTVAPLAFGAGVGAHGLDSLAGGVPCVCSPVAAEGLDLPGPLASLVGEDAGGMAASILAMQLDAEANAAAAAAGLAMIVEGHSNDALDRLMRGAAGLA